MRLPSGDHSGEASDAGSKVKRVAVPRATSIIQRSRPPAFPLLAIIRFSSGDNQGSLYEAAAPMSATAFPERSIMVSLVPKGRPARNEIWPVFETVKAA